MWEEIDVQDQDALDTFCSGMAEAHVADWDVHLAAVRAVALKNGRLFSYTNGAQKIWVVIKWNFTNEMWNLLFCSMEGFVDIPTPAGILRQFIVDFLQDEGEEYFYIRTEHSYPLFFQAFMGWFVNPENVPEIVTGETIVGSSATRYLFHKPLEA